MNDRRAWLLAVAEVAALAIFLYCAQIAKDIFLEINENEFNPGDAPVRFVEWHTYAREASWLLVALWLVAITLAVYEHVQGSKSLSDLLTYRPRAVVAITLGLPVAGLLAGFVFSLFLPGL